MDESLAVDSGGYLRMNSLRALIVAYLNVSWRSRGGGHLTILPGTKM